MENSQHTDVESPASPVAAIEKTSAHLEKGRPVHRAVERAQPGLCSQAPALLEAPRAEVLEGRQHGALDLDVLALAVPGLEVVPELLPVLPLVPPVMVILIPKLCASTIGPGTPSIFALNRRG